MRLMRFQSGWSRLCGKTARGLAAATCASVALVACIPAATGEAVAVEPYGEVTRFGGAVKEFALTSQSSGDEGKFVTPVGFAVEPEDPTTHEHNAVYVLDRTYVNVSKGELDYRLQKISSLSHEVLGTADVSESFTDKSTASDAHPLVGLAVDQRQERVYAIVESMVESESGSGEYVAVAGKLVAWSTNPVSKQLGRANADELPEEPVTKASVVATETTLKATGTKSEVLYAPEGLASDDGNGDIAIQAQLGVTGSTEPFDPGPTTVRIVHTEGIDAGQLGASWTESEAPKGTSHQEWLGNGVFATEESESFGVSLFTTGKSRPHLDVVKMSGTPSATEIAPFTASLAKKDFDEAPSVDLEYTPFEAPFNSDEYALSETLTAGTGVVQVGQNEYASLYALAGSGGVTNESQAEVSPWMVNGTEKAKQFWIVGGTSGTKELANLGIRIFEGDGRIIDTVGGGAPNSGTATGSSVIGSCNLDFRNATLAAGSGGAVFALTQSRGGEYDGEVIEFAPGGKTGACPAVRDGNVEVQEGGVWKELPQVEGESEGSVSVAEGVPAKFSAISLDNPLKDVTWNFLSYRFEWPLVYEWTPFAFEWNFEGKSTGGPADDGYTVVSQTEEASGYTWPTPEAEYTYDTAGIYDASVRLYGDYGTKVVPFTVHVLGSTPPQANFAVPGAITAGSPVTFDASASKPTPGAEIEYYEWNFGEGPEVALADTTEHTFTKAGKYDVTLVIHDKQGNVLTSAAAEHEVNVEAASTNTTNGGGSGGQGGGTTTSETSTTETTTTTTSSTTSSSSGKKTLTEHQKLEQALKACHKDKAKKKREKCEKTARKRFAPKKKAKPKKK